MFACLHGQGNLTALAFEFSPSVEATSADTVTFDVSGLDRLIGLPQEIASAIARRVHETGAKASVAVAANPDAAICAARGFRGTSVIPYGDEGKFLGARFEPKVPTVFEYLRKSFAVPPHQTLIVNGEDRPDEEFYAFSNHFAYGINYRSNMLSLYRFKAWLMGQQVAEGKLSDKQIELRKKELAKWEKVDYRTKGDDRQGPKLEAFWQRWREYYGDSGLVNPRGDRLLTELTVRALRELRPRLIMVNYQDCDYVHWGNLSHYTRAVSIMDEGVRQITETVEADAEYRSNTIFVVVPDCGRDSNPFADVPCQHHFNSRSAHEVFALFIGPGVPRGAVVDRRVDQSQVAATVGRLMGFKSEFAEQRILEEAIA